MKKLISFVAITLLFGSTAFQCNREECCVMPPCSEKSTLTGTWRLAYYEHVVTGVKDPDPGIDGESVTYQFTDDQKEGKIEGHTFANEVSGSYTLGQGCTFKVTAFGGTKVGEPGWSGKAWLPSDVSATGSYQVSESTLIITFALSPERLVFKKEK
jgi:hypothetical protein